MGAKDFIRSLLVTDQSLRPASVECLHLPWLRESDTDSEDDDEDRDGDNSKVDEREIKYDADNSKNDVEDENDDKDSNQHTKPKAANKRSKWSKLKWLRPK